MRMEGLPTAFCGLQKMLRLVCCRFINKWHSLLKSHFVVDWEYTCCSLTSIGETVTRNFLPTNVTKQRKERMLAFVADLKREVIYEKLLSIKKKKETEGKTDTSNEGADMSQGIALLLFL